MPALVSPIRVLVEYWIAVLRVFHCKFLSQPLRVDNNGALLPLILECVQFSLDFVELVFVA